MPKVWLLRIAIVLIAVFSVRAATVSWVDHDVEIVVRGKATADAPSGVLIPATADFRCSAPLSGTSSARPIDVEGEIVSTARQACSPFRTGRQVLFYIDLAALAIGLGLTFAPLRRALRSVFVRS